MRTYVNKAANTSVLVALLLLSCTKEAQISECFTEISEQEVILEATIASSDPDTKTVRQSDNKVFWAPGDAISLFYGSGSEGGNKFTALCTEPVAVTNFTGNIGVITGGGEISMDETYFWGVYPYSDSTCCNGSSITTILPAQQKTAAGSFGNGQFPTLGRSLGLTMAFYNICGGIKFTVVTEGIRSVEFRNLNGESIAGKLNVGFDQSGLPQLNGISDGSDTIVVTPEEGKTFVPGTEYYVVIPPVTMSSGLEVTYKALTTKATKTILSSIPITRSMFSILRGKDEGLTFEPFEGLEIDPVAISFNSETGYLADTQSGYLWGSSADAVANDASVLLQYNGGAVDMSELLSVVVSENGVEKSYSWGDFNALAPDYDLYFSLFPYVVGQNVTSEDMYGMVSGTYFTPCYVSFSDGHFMSCAISKGSPEGISAVGREPVVFVSLEDGQNNVIASGYFKIEITVGTPVSVEPEYYNYPSFGKLPFVASSFEKSISWGELAYFISENLHVNYSDFTDATDGYEFTGVYGIEGQNNAFVKLADANANQAETIYGNISYTSDSQGIGMTTALVWDISPLVIGAGKSKDIYLEFQGPKTVYFKLSVEIAKAASFDFGTNKIANEWYDDIYGEAKNTVHINVLVPSTQYDIDNGIVKSYYRNLNRFYIGGKPSVALSNEADTIYSDEDACPKSLIETTTKFYFDSEQPVINGYQLFASDAGDSLFVVTSVNNGNIIGYDAIASLDSLSGVITYLWEDGDTPAKELLNLWSSAETSQSRMLYANVVVRTTYGENRILGGEEHFHVRFIRPLNIEFETQDVAEESAVAGFCVKVVDFISSIVDWNHQRVITDILDSYDGHKIGVGENIIKGINMYKYYQLESLFVDLNHAERDHWKIGDDTARALICSVTPEARLTLGTVNPSTGVFTPGSSNIINIYDFASLNNVAINYWNGRAVVETFNIYIPVTIEYAWGKIHSEMVIHISPMCN